MGHDKPVIAVIGAGAMGSYYGGRLAQHGHDVHFLMRSGAAAVKEKGLVVKSCHGDFVLAGGSVRAYGDPAEMPPADLVIITLKSTANSALAKLVRPVVKGGTVFLTLQNGLGNEEALARLFGGENVLGGVAFVCINRREAGVIDHSAHGLIRVGEFEKTRGIQRPQEIAEMFRKCLVNCEALADLAQGRWEKLLWNIPFNGLSAALDQTTDRLLACEEGVALVRRVMEEVVVAAGGAGVTLARELIDTQIQRTRVMGAYYTSSHVDRREGRALEIDALFGEPLKRARAAGLSTPWLEMLYHALCVVDGARKN